MIFNQQRLGALIGLGAIALMAVISSTSLNSGVEALPTFSGALSCAKDYLVESVKQKLISRSVLVRSFNERMAQVNGRFAAAKNAGELDHMDEQAKSDFYYQMVVEELHQLRKQIQSGQVGESNAASLDLTSGPDGKLIGGCIDPDAVKQGWSASDASAAMMEDDDDDIEMAEADNQEDKLYAELQQLQDQAAREAEMGWSMDEETKNALKVRARAIVGELLNNEIRQLAMALLQSYITGGAMGPVLVALSASLKFKLVEYFMNSLMDIVSGVFGKRIELTSPIKAPADMDVDPVPVAA